MEHGIGPATDTRKRVGTVEGGNQRSHALVNRRVARECYIPNGSAHILDGHGRIVDLANNYSNISFNFGPTLLSWNCPQPMVQDDDALILSGPEQSRPGLCLRVEPDGDTRVLMAVLVVYKRRPLQ